jgi:hypothetical protein
MLCLDTKRGRFQRVGPRYLGGRGGPRGRFAKKRVWVGARQGLILVLDLVMYERGGLWDLFISVPIVDWLEFRDYKREAL